MAISETKMQIVIANYFKDECDVNTSIRQAFEKGFRIGVKKGAITNRPQGEWKGYNADKGGDWLRDDGTPVFLVCDKCYGTVINNGSAHWNYCPSCGARMKGADDE